MREAASIGFIGLGVMGEPMCRNLAIKSGLPVAAFDIKSEPLARIGAHGVRAATTAAEAARADVVFVSLPGGPELDALCRGASGLVSGARAGQTYVDLGTSPVTLTRALGAEFAARGADYADAPVARTREAAEQGTLSIMVGGRAEIFARIRPLLAHMASDITHCGGLGAGQVAKLVNNLVLFETLGALAEALALARRSGVDAKLLFETLAKGSADSFALRNHGMKSMLPGIFPERAFSVEYALKDLDYALALAKDAGLELEGAELAGRRLRAAIAAGDGKLYHPAIARLFEAKP
jgi:3-hydroxyisobutyrate dehydrogenase-like beta-hydroxyacid dehydrogenase